MSSPFVAEIRIFAGNFPPRGWATCDGQILAISQNTALFSLLGTTYGGNGQSNFALPNFQGRAPMQQGAGPGLTDRVLGELGGSPTVSVLQTEMPQHTHQFMAGAGGARGGSTSVPTNNDLGTGTAGTDTIYGPTGANVQMNPQMIGLTGGSQPHNNMSPYLVLTFIIALVGIFPARP
jgi:microcystin-dependent protein